MARTRTRARTHPRSPHTYIQWHTHAHKCLHTHQEAQRFTSTRMTMNDRKYGSPGRNPIMKSAGRYKGRRGEVGESGHYMEVWGKRGKGGGR